MSEIVVNAQPQAAAPSRRDSADQHALAQVEKWMALIREISSERRSAGKAAS